MRKPLAVFLLVITAVAVQAQAPRAALKVGDKAPDFALPNGDGKLVLLSEYTMRGPVVLIFYRGFW
jgi:peroxiredoxin